MNVFLFIIGMIALLGLVTLISCWLSFKYPLSSAYTPPRPKPHCCHCYPSLASAYSDNEPDYSDTDVKFTRKNHTHKG